MVPDAGSRRRLQDMRFERRLFRRRRRATHAAQATGLTGPPGVAGHGKVMSEMRCVICTSRGL